MNNSFSRFLLYEPALLSIIFDIFYIIEKNALFTRIGICSKMMLAATEMIYLHISTILSMLLIYQNHVIPMRHNEFVQQ